MQHPIFLKILWYSKTNDIKTRTFSEYTLTLVQSKRVPKEMPVKAKTFTYKRSGMLFNK